MLAVVVFAGVAHADPGTTWEKKISKSRFLVLTDFDGAAVFDKETGRVWEQSPSTSLFNSAYIRGGQHEESEKDFTPAPRLSPSHDRGRPTFGGASGIRLP